MSLQSAAGNEVNKSAALAASSTLGHGGADSGVAALLADWFQRGGAPAFIVAADLTVITANFEGRRLLSAHGDIRLSEGRLCFPHLAQTDALRALLGLLGDAPKVWSFARSDEGGFWVLRTHKLYAADEPPAFSVSLTDSASRPARIWADLSVPFLLTPAEERVARYLFEGQTATELADTMGITIETARTYIRRIYLKTGASSREKLHSALEAFQTT